MGQNMGQLISRLGGNLRDIDIKNLTLSLIKQTGCTYSFNVLNVSYSVLIPLWGDIGNLRLQA